MADDEETGRDAEEPEQDALAPAEPSGEAQEPATSGSAPAPEGEEAEPGTEGPQPGQVEPESETDEAASGTSVAEAAGGEEEQAADGSAPSAGAPEPGSADEEAEPGSTPSASGEESGTDEESAPASGASAEVSGDEPTDAHSEVVASEDGAPQEGAPEPEGEEGGPTEEEVILPEVSGVSLPLVGRLSVKALLALTAVAAVAFLAVLIIAVNLWQKQAAPAPGRRVAAVAARPGPGGPAGAAAVDLGALDYEELMQEAALAERDADYSTAAVLYREAGEREEAGLPKTLLARHKLSTVLCRLGRCQAALRVCDSLRSVSRPGDELWKHALIGSIRALAPQQRWEELFRHVYLLRANSARYADEDALNRWLAYCSAMHKTRVLLSRAGPKADLFGMPAPPLGREPAACRPLVAEEIVPTSGNYGDASYEVAFQMGELRLTAEGAPVGDVLDAVAEASGLNVKYEDRRDYPVSACLETISPAHALELVLGSLGMAPEEAGDRFKVGPLRPLPRSQADGLKEALWALQEFLILYPESAHVPEAYYALAHLYMMVGRTSMALDQIEILCKEFPDSPWSVHGHYVAGRTYCGQRDWRRAEDQLLRVVDSGQADDALLQSAFLWAGQSQVHLGRYEQAVACFRHALASEPQDPLTPSILYNIAYCLEKSGASPLEVEDRYTELRTRYTGTEYAREADYRLARIPFEAGHYDRAIPRYEFYLSNYPLEAERTCEACADLLTCYGRAGEYVRGAVLADVMCNAAVERADFRRALPAIVEAYRKAGLPAAGLEATERMLEVVEDGPRRDALRVARARFLAEFGRTEEAHALAARLAEEVGAPELRDELNLMEADLLAGQAKADQALELYRQVALEGRSDAVREKALRMIGRYCEAAKQFEEAALAYAGKCPLPREGDSP
jgi:tetratricopeptide (TPR) repeat protein